MVSSLMQVSTFTTQKIKFSIKVFFCKCDQIRRKLRIWSHLLKKSLMKNFIFCAVVVACRSLLPISYKIYKFSHTYFDTELSEKLIELKFITTITESLGGFAALKKIKLISKVFYSWRIKIRYVKRWHLKVNFVFKNHVISQAKVSKAYPMMPSWENNRTNCTRSQDYTSKCFCEYH